MNYTKKSYAVIYPQGTSDSYQLFSNLQSACEFLDTESNHSGVMLPDSELTIMELDGSMEEIEDKIMNSENGLSWLNKNAVKSETVSHWRIESDNVDTYESEEEAIEANLPSQYLTNF